MTDTVASDMLRGATQIADFMGLNPRQVYYAAENTLPVFRIGTQICARKSTLLRWIEEQEQAATRTVH